MSTYQELRGLKVKYLAANPDPGTAGDVWYDSVTYQLKGFVGRAAWSAGSSMSNAKNFRGGAGTQTAGLAYGGASPYIASTEEYNGTGWASGGDLNTARSYLSGCQMGTQTAAVAAGGYDSTAAVSNVEEYNGTTWTEVTNVPAARGAHGSVGTLTAGMTFGGATPPGLTSNVAETYEYDGTNWTDGSDLNTARRGMGSAGILTAGLAFGGTGDTNATEEYDGTSWANGEDMNAAKIFMASFGVQTLAISAGDNASSPKTACLEYDGTDWSTSPASLATGRGRVGGLGTSGTAGLAFGGDTAGDNTGIVAVTEEYNNTFEVITAGAWASGGDMNTAKKQHAAAAGATANAAIVTAGAFPPTSTLDITETYDGTSWTEAPDLGTARKGHAMAGTSTAALAANGENPGGSTVDSEEFDGSSWTEGDNVPSALNAISGFGTQTAAVLAGQAKTREYNGTSWSEGEDMPATQHSGAGAGTLTAGLFFGGITPSPNQSDTFCLEYDGTDWASGGSTITARRLGGGAGALQTDALVIAGEQGDTQITTCEGYDGTSWSTRPSVATGRARMKGCGTTAAAIGAGGNSPPGVGIVTTEEFTGDIATETGSTIDFD